MHILQSVIRFAPAIGGVEDYVRYLSLGLAKKGHELDVVTTDLAHHQKLQRLQVSSYEIENIKIFRHRVLPVCFKKYMIAPGMLKSLCATNADLIHGHSYMYSSADLALLSARIKKIPFVFTPYLSGQNNPSVFGKVYRKCLGDHLFNADCVIVISPYERDLVLSWGFKPKRIEQVCPGVDISKFEQIAHDDIFLKYGIKHEHKVLFVGRLDYMKGLDVLVKAAARVVKRARDVCFVVVGPDFGYKEKLLSMIRERDLEKNFSFLDAVSAKDLIQLYKQCTLFAFPSRYEAFGIVLAEAMAAEKAVVATNYSAIPNVVQDKKTGLLFEYENDFDFAEKITLLLKDESLRTNMGQAGYMRVKENFNWDKSVEKLEKVYKEFI